MVIFDVLASVDYLVGIAFETGSNKRFNIMKNCEPTSLYRFRMIHLFKSSIYVERFIAMGTKMGQTDDEHTKNEV